MRRFAALLLSIGLLPLAGCRTCEPVENELRARDHDLRELRSELERTESYNQYLQRELRNLQAVGLCPPVVEGAGPGPASTATPIKSIQLGRQTGGLNEDGLPGDECLQVVIEPRDFDGHAVKAAGSVQIHALEISPEGLKNPLCSWAVPPEQLRRSWRGGLLATGYFLVFPWKVFPTTEKVRVLVQFTMPDGRVFEADRDVIVRVVPHANRHVPPEALEEPYPLPPPTPVPPGSKPASPAPPMPPADKQDTDTLPPPRKVEPPGVESPVEGPALSRKREANPTSRSLEGVVEMLKPVVQEENR
jgi:hypothetical protein